MLFAKTRTKNSQSLSSCLYHSTSIDNLTTSDYSLALYHQFGFHQQFIAFELEWWKENGQLASTMLWCSSLGVSVSHVVITIPLAIFEDNTFLCQHAKYPKYIPTTAPGICCTIQLEWCLNVQCATAFHWF